VPRLWRSLNSIVLKTANLPIQSAPNASSAAVITIAIDAACEAVAWLANVLAKSAAQMDRARPRNASAQNGTTSFHRWERPRRPHAQLRVRH
jgi:hypothetical protein